MKKYILLVGALMLIPFGVNAENGATINIKTDYQNPKVGTTITVKTEITSQAPIGYYEYTLDYSSKKLKLEKGSPYNVNKSDNNTTTKITKDFKFKVLQEGKIKISAKSYAISNIKNENLTVTVNPLTIVSGNSKTSLSENNNLKELKIEGYKLEPTFDKNQTEYKLNINKNIDEVNIIATPESNKATVNGAGKISVVPGENKLEVVVTSESDENKTYTILLTTKDDKEIKVTVDGKQYTIVKNEDALDIPDGYEFQKTTIEGSEITGLYSKTTGYFLIGLKDEDDNIELYIYDKDNNTYSLYKEITVDKISFIPVKTKEKLNNFIKTKIEIDKINVECYKTKEYSNFCYIYGLNTKTGEKGWYSYNTEEKTIQKFNTDLEDYYKEKVKNTQNLIYILGGTTLIFGITVIVLATKLGQKRRR